MNERKPFIVEFTGTPEAGKTTVINILYEQLLKKGYKIKIYPESAENTPAFFQKGSIEAKMWMNFDTSKHILEAAFLHDYDIIIFDRGAIDRIFWIYLDSIYNPEVISKKISFKNFFKDYPPDLLIAFYIPEDESIKRRGGEGRLVTKDFVSNYNQLFKTFIISYNINKVIVDTNNKSIEEVVEVVESYILENLKSHS